MAADNNDSAVMAALHDVINWLNITVTPSALLKRIKEVLPDLPLRPDEKRQLPAFSGRPIRPTLLFGLSGIDGVGKTTAAKWLERRGYLAVAFGESVKIVVSALYSIDRQTLEGDDPVSRVERELPLSNCPTLTMRDVMRLLATEVFRSIDDTVWIRHAARRMTSERVVITDIRFANELEFVKRLNGVTVLITSPNAVSTSTHESQRGLKEHLFTSKINNSETISVLHAKLAIIEDMMASAMNMYIPL